MTNKTVLIVEDEIKLARILEDYLTQALFLTHSIHDGNQVLDWLEHHHVDAIILDIMLPGKDGLQICREIRQFSQVPILMVTAKAEENDRLIGLELGVDDYICKPFSPREVVARVKTVLRRTNPVDDKSVSGFKIDQDKMQVAYNQQHVTLTTVEFHILQRLESEQGRIFSRDQLMNCIYSDNRIVSDRTIDSHIKKLRKKIQTLCDKEIIHSVYGVGYKFVWPT